MKAVTVTPGVRRSGRLREVPTPSPGPGEALVRVLDVGLDGTDAEIDEGLYGEAPAGDGYLIIGHESLGQVVEVGPEARGVKPGDLVVATVRRPGDCLTCRVGESDMCLDGRYTERGIRGRHGYMAEYYAESTEYLVPVPAEFRPFAVLLEPMTIVEKGIAQSFAIQRRLRWAPRTAVILGAGTIGLFAALLLRGMGLEVTVVGREPEDSPTLKLDILRAVGAAYRSSERTPILDLPKHLGNIDLVLEATGSSQVVFDAMQILGVNGVLCLLGITGGDRKIPVPADRINLEFVLGNKVAFGSVNANRRYFELGVAHFGDAERRWPGLLGRFVTKRLPLAGFREGLEIRREHVKVVLEAGQ
jgi:glucose 1-dehydrogenase